MTASGTVIWPASSKISVSNSTPVSRGDACGTLCKGRYGITQPAVQPFNCRFDATSLGMKAGRSAR